MLNFWEWIERIVKALIKLIQIIFGGKEDEGHNKRDMDPDEGSRDEEDIKDDPEVISPPILIEPLYQCSKVVIVKGFIPHAKLSIEINGIEVSNVTAGYPDPQGEVIGLPNELIAGDEVISKKIVEGVVSEPSNKVIVQNHTDDYPYGLPRPEVNPAPVYECGLRTGVGNVLIGSKVWINVDNNKVGEVDGANEQQGVNVNPGYSLNQNVVIQASLCNDKSSPSEIHLVQNHPPLNAPQFDPIYLGAEQIRVIDLINGAKFSTYRYAADLGTRRTWGGAHLIEINPSASAGESFTATQMMCPDDGSSGDGTTTTLPCADLPSPRIAPVQTGDTTIRFIEHIPDSRKKVFSSGNKIGDGSGAEIALTRPLKKGETLQIYQVLGDCIGSTVRIVDVKCVAAPTMENPDRLNIFPVGTSTYSGNSFTFAGQTLSVRGTIFYPAQSDGENVEFHKRLADDGAVPLVLFQHGNHGVYRDPDDHLLESCNQLSGYEEIPNHRGYEYFQHKLARMGIASLGVYTNETNCASYSETNIRKRAEILRRTLLHFKNEQANGTTIHGGAFDLNNIGLFGHSRGGDAVVLASDEINETGIAIKAVFSLAPTDAVAAVSRSVNYAFLTLLPAADGDVRGNDGAKFYDASKPSPFKSQLYVHGTNHNRYNRMWVNDDSNVGLPIISRNAHERIITSYGSAFFRKALLGHSTLQFLSGEHVPVGIPHSNVCLSFDKLERDVVDEHEESGGIAKNTMNQNTVQADGFSADEYRFTQSSAAFNYSFYGDSNGMVATSEKANGVFTSPLDDTYDLTDRFIHIRAAEVYNMDNIPNNTTGFELGVVDLEENEAWITSACAGGLPRPQKRSDNYTKTMLKTLRFPAQCFLDVNNQLKLEKIRTIRIRLYKDDRRHIAFDDLQIADPIIRRS